MRAEMLELVVEDERTLGCNVTCVRLSGHSLQPVMRRTGFQPSHEAGLPRRCKISESE